MDNDEVHYRKILGYSSLCGDQRDISMKVYIQQTSQSALKKFKMFSRINFFVFSWCNSSLKTQIYLPSLWIEIRKE